MKSDIKVYKEIQILISSKKFDECLNFIDKNKAKLNELDYWFLLSVNLRYLEQYQKALKTLSKVNKINPLYGRAFQEFGHNYVKLNNKEMALKSYSRAV